MNKPKNWERVRDGRKGGRKRMASLSAKQRKELAKKAAEARWGKR